MLRTGEVMSYLS